MRAVSDAAMRGAADANHLHVSRALNEFERLAAYGVEAGGGEGICRRVASGCVNLITKVALKAVHFACTVCLFAPYVQVNPAAVRVIRDAAARLGLNTLDMHSAEKKKITTDKTPVKAAKEEAALIRQTDDVDDDAIDAHPVAAAAAAARSALAAEADRYISSLPKVERARLLSDMWEAETQDGKWRVVVASAQADQYGAPDARGESRRALLDAAVRYYIVKSQHTSASQF